MERADWRVERWGETVGPVRHKQFIQVLAFVVAIDMAVGVVAVYARGDRASAGTAATPLEQSGSAPAGVASANGATGGGILAGAQFRNRRRSTPGAEGDTAAGAVATEAAAAGSPATSASTWGPTTAGSAGPRATSTGSAGRATPATPGRPTTTATRPAPSAATGTGAGGTPTTAAPNTGIGGGGPVSEDPVDPAQNGGGSTGGGSTGGGSPGGGGSTGTTATTATTRPTATSGPRTPRITIDDRTGDTVLEGTTTPASQPRADLVESQANYTAKALLLTAKTADTVQPKDDPRWLSESTFVSWELDTNRDGTVDYEVQFFFAEGTLIAGVSRPGDTDSQSACAAEAGQTADGYTVGIDPACIGNPGSFSYRVTTYYDLDPSSENTNDVVTDVAPDGGWSRPVSRP